MFASEAAKVIGIDLVKLAVTDRQIDTYQNMMIRIAMTNTTMERRRCQKSEVSAAFQFTS